MVYSAIKLLKITNSSNKTMPTREETGMVELMHDHDSHYCWIRMGFRSTWNLRIITWIFLHGSSLANVHDYANLPHLSIITVLRFVCTALDNPS